MNNQKGFVLTELIVSIAIMVAIALGASMSIGQVYKVTRQNNDKATAVQQAQNAGYWISHDGLMANNVDGTSLNSPIDTFNFTWSDWETGYTHVVEYSLVPSDGLFQLSRRTTIIAPGGNTETVAFIANHIVKVEKMDIPLQFTVTALSGTETVIRKYTVSPRLNPD